MMMARSLGTTSVDNPHLGGMDGDYLYPLGLTKDDAPAFSDVKFFCTGGSAHRMGEFAQVVADELSASGLADVPFGLRPTPIAKTDRFSTYKVGPVLMSNHGMGMPSVSILLHEVTKLLHYAGAARSSRSRLIIFPQQPQMR